MTDYAATSVQPIVQGLLTVSGAAAPSPHVPTFTGRGVSAVARVVVAGNIAYVFTLDAGLPGNAGEVEPSGVAYPAAQVPGAGSGAELPQTNVPVPDVRSYFTLRGSSSAVIPGSSTITSTAVTWLTPGVDGGFTQFQLVFLNAAGATVDPTDLVAAGVEIVIGKRQPTA
ncbi:MAG TPA: hypothetical protein VFA98_04230 [Thermoanaerobaculia bacterium]|jgi:hypothetical protein|nr:hypothetical protein [Thermoanaerobaculia bacterium]